MFTLGLKETCGNDVTRFAMAIDCQAQLQLTLSMKFAPVYSSSISQRHTFRMMVKIRFGRLLSEPRGLRNLISSLA